MPPETGPTVLAITGSASGSCIFMVMARPSGPVYGVQVHSPPPRAMTADIGAPVLDELPVSVSTRHPLRELVAKPIVE